MQCSSHFGYISLYDSCQLLITNSALPWPPQSMDCTTTTSAGLSTYPCSTSTQRPESRSSPPR
ncbi:hypothetical protein B0H17DRAFT_1075235 [Mycena rosella]|uniref:Uncharacterized protein n=1 Tax=Mycena rosella TaxID=1033263 RepID=A0AAD7D6Y9_MYCRO|nr:hypothetical protein B0H17DRAFT_1075235 [Mycena rosella]